jgi:hypothetical protein
MPGFDRTGPAGAGPGTGWRQGRCFGFGTRGAGRARGGFWRRQGAGFCRRLAGFGGGLGWGRRGGLQPGQEKDALLQEKSWLEEKLRAIEDRLSSLRS